MRIAGVELPDHKNVGFALTIIRGVGWPTSLKILEKLNIDPHSKVKELKDQELSGISRELESLIIEGELLHQTRQNIQRLSSLGFYRGTRHLRNLPSRGQRTRTNARTKRGKRKTVGAFKKETLAKIQQQKDKGAK